MKVIAIFTVIAGIFGCRAPGEKPFMLDGPGMVYVDSEHRTEYANTLPFDEIDDYPYWAVAYLGEGENGKNTAKEYIEKLFSKLSEEQRKAVKHYDYGGEKMVSCYSAVRRGKRADSKRRQEKFAKST